MALGGPALRDGPLVELACQTNMLGREAAATLLSGHAADEEVNLLVRLSFHRRASISRGVPPSAARHDESGWK
jgi:hypothetical protein